MPSLLGFPRGDCIDFKSTAFDAGLVDFDASGRIRFAERFTPDDRLAAGLQDEMTLSKLTPEHRTFLAWRRASARRRLLRDGGPDSLGPLLLAERAIRRANLR
jgi:hypothetical protein